MGARLARDDDFFPPVLVQVRGDDIQARTRLPAMDDLFSEGHLAVVLQFRQVTDDHNLILRPAILSAVRVVALAGNDLGVAVLVEIVPSEGMHLADCLVDHVMLPDRGAVLAGLKLLVVVESVVVAVSPNQVLPAILVQVLDENGTMALGKVNSLRHFHG